MVFVNRHLKVPKWFKEWYDKLDFPDELYDKIAYSKDIPRKIDYGKIPYAIGKIVNVSSLDVNNIWDSIETPFGYLNKKDKYPQNIDIIVTNNFTYNNKLYLIEALVDKYWETDTVVVHNGFKSSAKIEKIISKEPCLDSIVSLADVAIGGYSSESYYKIPQRLKKYFVSAIQINFLLYVTYLLSKDEGNERTWK